MRSWFSTDNGKNVLSGALDARKLLPFAFVLMVIFLCAMLWDSFARTRELLSSQEYVEHTHQVLYELDAIQDGLGDAREQSFDAWAIAVYDVRFTTHAPLNGPLVPRLSHARRVYL